jgi:hypothetical protein
MLCNTREQKPMGREIQCTWITVTFSGFETGLPLKVGLNPCSNLTFRLSFTQRRIHYADSVAKGFLNGSNRNEMWRDLPEISFLCI